jgi:hypothetical protein
MSTEAQAFFAVSSMVIAVPTGIKVFSWIATMWRGSVEFRTPMLWAKVRHDVIGILEQAVDARVGEHHAGDATNGEQEDEADRSRSLPAGTTGSRK